MVICQINSIQHVNKCYQLLTATSGTLIEVRKVKISKALLLIIIFINKSNTVKIKFGNNIKDIEEYKRSLLNRKLSDKFNLSGFSDIDFYIEHIEINI